MYLSWPYVNTVTALSLTSYLIFDWVGRVLLLLALLVWPADVQILHVSGENLGHANAWQDAHDWSQNQHQTHLRRQETLTHVMYKVSLSKYKKSCFSIYFCRFIAVEMWQTPKANRSTAFPGDIRDEHIALYRTYHDSWEVHAGDSIHDDEDPGIRKVVETVVKTDCEERKGTSQSQSQQGYAELCASFA